MSLFAYHDPPSTSRSSDSRKELDAGTLPAQAPLSSFGSSDRDRSVPEGRELSKRALPLTPVAIIVDRHLHRVDALQQVGPLQVHELLGSVEGKPAMEGTIDDGEHHGCQADSKGEGDNCDDRDTRTLAESSQRVLDVL